MEAKHLMKMSYFDPKTETRLEAYADTVVIEKEGSISYFAAVRLGGYPESVKGMSEAIYGGGSVSVVINDKHITVYSRTKQYRKEFSHDGIYAESTLLINDEELGYSYNILSFFGSIRFRLQFKTSVSAQLF